jgi:hypothetical protein
MPLHLEWQNYTAEQIGEAGGVAAIHGTLIARALNGGLAHLKDGRGYVIQIHPRNPQPVPGQEGQSRIQVEIRWLIAQPDQAKIGEIVYAPMLTADDKGEDVQRFEATRNGMRFEPHVNGWQRVQPPEG